MAIGDSYNYEGNNNTDNNKKEFKENEVYSNYNISNEDGVDPSALSYSFWNGCLKVSIAPKLDNPTTKRKWDHKNAAVAFLNHNSARILREEALKVLNGEQNNGGVKIGSKATTTLLSFSNGEEVGANGYCLIMRSIEDNGTINGTYVYEFHSQYHYGVKNFQADTSKFSKTYYDQIEVTQFLDMLEQYYLAMTNATAYSVMSQMKFETSRLNTKIGLIAESLGVEFKGNYGGRSGGGERGTSYFDQQGGEEEEKEPRSNSPRQTTIDNIGN